MIENGVGYDTYMEKIESASPRLLAEGHQRAEAARAAGLDSEPAPLVQTGNDAGGREGAGQRPLGARSPRTRRTSRKTPAKFDESLKPWYAAIAKFKAAYPNTPVATTEPVGDYMLEAAGTKNMTPFSLQADIMNGTDPAPQNVTLQNGLFSGHKVKVFVYNQQVTDSLTESFCEGRQARRDPGRRGVRDDADARL